MAGWILIYFFLRRQFLDCLGPALGPLMPDHIDLELYIGTVLVASPSQFQGAADGLRLEGARIMHGSFNVNLDGIRPEIGFGRYGGLNFDHP